jgi:TonB family protein
MKSWVLIAVAAALVGGAAHGQALHAIPSDPKGNLVWRMKPNGADIAAIYPQKAQREEKAGWAIVECQSEASGDLKDCRILGEAPADYGFGAAALKLTSKFKLDPKKNDPAELAGGVVAIPIVLLTPTGAPVPPFDALAGDPSVMLTPAAKGPAPCPTSAAPAQTCGVHKFTWATRPRIAETAALVRGAAATPASTTVLCPLAENMKLARCTLTGPADPSQVTAMTGLIPLFTAPAQTDDKATTQGGFALVQFNWASLKRAVEASALTTPRQP